MPETCPMVDAARERLQKMDTFLSEADILVGELLTTIGRWEEHHLTQEGDLAAARSEIDRLRAELQNQPKPDRSEAESLKAKVAQLERAVALKDVQLDEARDTIKDLKSELDHIESQPDSE